MKWSAARIGWIALHVFLFLLAFAGTIATFFVLFVPAVLIGLPVAMSAKSPRAKSLAITMVMGSIIWIPIWLIGALFGLTK